MIVDTVANSKLLLEDVWNQLCGCRDNSDPKLKKNKCKFLPFGTYCRLEYIGRSKIKSKAVAGDYLKTIS